MVKSLRMITPTGGNVEVAVRSTPEGASVMRDFPGHLQSSLLPGNPVSSWMPVPRRLPAPVLAEGAGKPITDARREVCTSCHTLSIAAEEAKRIWGRCSR